MWGNTKKRFIWDHLNLSKESEQSYQWMFESKADTMSTFGLLLIEKESILEITKFEINENVINKEAFVSMSEKIDLSLFQTLGSRDGSLSNFVNPENLTMYYSSMSRNPLHPFLVY